MLFIRCLGLSEPSSRFVTHVARARAWAGAGWGPGVGHGRCHAAAPLCNPMLWLVLMPLDLRPWMRKQLWCRARGAAIPPVWWLSGWVVPIVPGGNGCTRPPLQGWQRAVSGCVGSLSPGPWSKLGGQSCHPHAPGTWDRHLLAGRCSASIDQTYTSPRILSLVKFLCLSEVIFCGFLKLKMPCTRSGVLMRSLSEGSISSPSVL